MKKENLKILRLAVGLALIFSLLMSSVRFEAGCSELKENILRIHIIANSDSEADQELKLKVRDALLELGSNELCEAENINDAIIAANASINDFHKTAKAVIEENGYDYNVSVGIEKQYFDTRVYDEFTLPAGEYEALCVKIGKAEGKNWWCVMYPAVCIPAATADLGSAVSVNAEDIANNPQKYVIKFKTVEIFEGIKNFLKNIK